MRHVVFVAPFPAETTLRFMRACASLRDVHLSVVAHTPPHGEDAGVPAALELVRDPMAPEQLADAISRLARRYGKPARILGLLEPLQVTFAKLREHFGVAGTGVATAELFRDKAKMKDALRAAGLPCARHRLLHSVEEGAAFAAEVGFPLIVKPPAGMGCKATWRIASMEQLRAAIAALKASLRRPLLAEEMVVGTEHSFDTITIDGKVMMGSITDYRPTPLEVVENPWIQWVVLAPRELDGAVYEQVRRVGQKAIQALGLDSAMTHMEWFQRADGSLAIGEIAARPPGANMARLTGLAYDTSMYRAWARALVDNAFDGPWERKFATGAAFLRGVGSGRVLGLNGVAKTQQAIGELIVEAKLPVIGAPKSDSYEGDGYVLVRHSSTEVVRAALNTIINTVRVYYG